MKRERPSRGICLRSSERDERIRHDDSDGNDEFNCQTRDNNGNFRSYRPRSFSSLSQAEEENGQSRIYLNIHWAFDKTQGIALGRRVGDSVFDRAFTPIRTRRSRSGQW